MKDNLQYKIALWTTLHNMIISLQNRNSQMPTVVTTMVAAASVLGSVEKYDVIFYFIPCIVTIFIFYFSFSLRSEAIISGYLAGLEEDINKDLGENVYMWHKNYRYFYDNKDFLTNNIISLGYLAFYIVITIYSFHQLFRIGNFINILLYLIIYIVLNVAFIKDLLTNPKISQKCRNNYFYMHVCISSIEGKLTENEVRKFFNKKNYQIQKKEKKPWWKKWRIITCSFIILVVLIIVISDYLLFKSNDISILKPKYEVIDLKNKIQLIGLSDSIGVPYNDSKGIGFFDLLEFHLKNNMVDESLNLYNLYTNKTWHIQGLLENSVTLDEYRLIQKFSYDFNKEKFPEYIKADINYPVDLNGNRTISNIISEYSKPIFIYSCGANDLFYYFNFNPAHVTPKKICELLSGYSDSLESLGKNIDRNLEKIIEVNPNVQIIVLGMYNPFNKYSLNRITSPIIGRINQSIKSVVSKYDNVHYLDVEFLTHFIDQNDFHPSDEGQLQLYYSVRDSIIEICMQNDNNTYGSSGNQNNESVAFDNVSSWNYEDIATKLSSYIEQMAAYSKLSYIDYAVIIESYFNSANINLNYMDMIELKSLFKALNLEKNKYSDMKNILNAFDVLIIERKMEYGFDDMKRTYKNLKRENDKLSLNVQLFNEK